MSNYLLIASRFIPETSVKPGKRTFPYPSLATTKFSTKHRPSESGIISSRAGRVKYPLLRSTMPAGCGGKSVSLWTTNSQTPLNCNHWSRNTFVVQHFTTSAAASLILGDHDQLHFYLTLINKLLLLALDSWHKPSNVLPIRNPVADKEGWGNTSFGQ